MLHTAKHAVDLQAQKERGSFASAKLIFSLQSWFSFLKFQQNVVTAKHICLHLKTLAEASLKLWHWAHSRQIIWQCVATGIASQELENPGGNGYLLVCCLPQVALAVKANRRDEDTQISKRKQIMCNSSLFIILIEEYETWNTQIITGKLRNLHTSSSTHTQRHRSKASFCYCHSQIHNFSVKTCLLVNLTNREKCHADNSKNTLIRILTTHNYMLLTPNHSQNLVFFKYLYWQDFVHSSVSKAYEYTWRCDTSLKRQ